MNTKLSSQSPKPRKTARLDTLTRDLAASLRNSINATDQDALENDPEETFVDLATDLVHQLRKRGLTVVSLPTREQQIDIVMANAAARALRVFTQWMQKNPGRSYDTRMSVSGKVQVVMKTPDQTQLFFGGDIQDAYGQAAQTILCSDEK